MAPTGDQVVSYAMSLRKANYGPPENVNQFTRKYYGNGTKASWCEIFEWNVFDHFPGGSTIFHGKSAYVPDMPKHFGKDWRPHSDKSIYPGCPVALGLNNIAGPEHTGLFVRWANSAKTSFVCIEGNTTQGSSDDAVDDKTRSWSSVTGWAAIKFAPADPSVYPGVIYKYTKGKSLMSGTHVKWIQQRLTAHKHAVSVDSQYGPKTAAAVKAFQQDAHLTADSQVGPKTWTALAK
jgi:peptidoglycan hydrolase-like protein with peptidoglycan-binding domain